MASRRTVENVNPVILRQCREQIGLNIQQAEKKIPIKTLEKLEKGESKPTFIQVEKLAALYRVPQWVFLRETLPSQYDFDNQLLSFRTFTESSPAFENHKVRLITASVEQFRKLILELREDMDEPVRKFNEPETEGEFVKAANLAREWLGILETDNHSFGEWKQMLEGKEIFIFCTSKYSSWSKVEPTLFRGFCIYKEVLPIIVINDSDALSAQSFTLFHELGHLFRKESSLDVNISSSQNQAENWCDKFASEFLMPSGIFLQKISSLDMGFQLSADMINIDKVAKDFKVSSLACAFRMREAEKITWEHYKEIEKFLKERRENLRQKQRNQKLQIKRNIAKEALNQYGGLCSRAMVQAYRDNEIGLHKLCKFFGIKKTSDAIKLEGML